MGGSGGGGGSGKVAVAVAVTVAMVVLVVQKGLRRDHLIRSCLFGSDPKFTRCQ